MRESVMEGQEQDAASTGRHPGGRPTKLTREVIEKIAELVRAGNYMVTAAAYVGVNRDTLYAWLRRGAAARSGLYREFSDSIGVALAGAEIDPLKLITEAGQKEWRALAWRLERRYPDRWGRLERIEHTGADGKDLFDGAALMAHPTLAPLQPDDRRRVAAGLRKILPMLAAVGGGEEDEEVEAEGEVIDVSPAEGSP